MLIIQWYQGLDEPNKNTWKCEYCKGRGLEKARNCGGKYAPASIIVNNTLLTECPLTVAKSECSEIYNILKSTLMSGMGGSFLPSELLDELNVYFVYRDIVQSAESKNKEL